MVFVGTRINNEFSSLSLLFFLFSAVFFVFVLFRVSCKTLKNEVQSQNFFSVVLFLYSTTLLVRRTEEEKG